MSRPARLFVLGGARSGKSSYAQARVEAWGSPRTYLATAPAFDDEMDARIAQHRAERGPGWHLLEAPMNLADAIQTAGARGYPILIDCLTLWASNLLLAEQSPEAEIPGLLNALAGCPVPVALVSNEVGLGIVPDNALARRFRDAVGRVHQRLAAEAGEVVFMVAGLPMWVKRP
ncbi:MAG: bifunctional adenosylcobinamide kinase/adenosylcobinamide-phosphate guanylyltransferase [Elstera sp.]